MVRLDHAADVPFTDERRPVFGPDDQVIGHIGGPPVPLTRYFAGDGSPITVTGRGSLPRWRPGRREDLVDTLQRTGAGAEDLRSVDPAAVAQGSGEIVRGVAELSPGLLGIGRGCDDVAQEDLQHDLVAHGQSGGPAPRVSLPRRLVLICHRLISWIRAPRPP